ncbi:16S rRNA (uracil1498-N3)-methyltransferase [Brevinema andersonii]|uniref:Ribosomal RNA small subunit methyltransferase E n=1 Tax=Brevinema andersonii TaxID=34097 RepID=A0A1I1D685_BREAD|nr:RsmE family RNA methyltransferase [Brevinema andersonii]SFB68598.1 16S rRNA (uracil1498-N3)-methyltransferase [Brevinema andersonii]
MRRFMFSDIPDEQSIFQPSVDQVHHMIKVLRLRPGGVFEAADGRGGIAELEMLDTFGNLRVIAKYQGNEIPLSVSACIAELKNDAMEQSISMLAEIGIQRIIPFYSERSIPKFNSKDRVKKQQRRQKIANEAIKKVGGLFSCIVEESQMFDYFLQQLMQFSTKIVFWEHTHTRILGFPESSIFEHTAFVIGPEGGFSPNEIKSFSNIECIFSSLGTRILKAPQAAAAAAYLVRYLSENIISPEVGKI